MSLPVKMVWFDLDDTLFDHSYSVGKGLERVQQEYPGFLSRQTPELVRLYNLALNEVYPDFLSGKIDFPEMRRRKFDRFLLKSGISKAEVSDAATFHRIYDEAYNRERRATPGSIDGVQRLQDLGVAVAVLTNGIRQTQEEKLRIAGFESLVPFLLTSEEAGAAKPDARVFEWALQRTRKTAEDVVMVGDNLVNDIYGAKNVGIRAIYYSPVEGNSAITTEFGSVPVMSAWGQLPDLLEKEAVISGPTKLMPR